MVSPEVWDFPTTKAHFWWFSAVGSAPFGSAAFEESILFAEFFKRP